MNGSKVTSIRRVQRKRKGKSESFEQEMKHGMCTIIAKERAKIVGLRTTDFVVTEVMMISTYSMRKQEFL